MSLLPRIGEIWETDWEDGRVRQAMVETEQVTLRFLDDNTIETVEKAALAFLPGSRWRRVSTAAENPNEINDASGHDVTNYIGFSPKT